MFSGEAFSLILLNIQTILNYNLQIDNEVQLLHRQHYQNI